ncbi:MAG: hypothetical protein WAL59_27180 [Roseiarcus sp.]
MGIEPFQGDERRRHLRDLRSLPLVVLPSPTPKSVNAKEARLVPPGQIKYYLCMSQYQNDHNINFIVRSAVYPVDKNFLVPLTEMVALAADGENYFTRLLP